MMPELTVDQRLVLDWLQKQGGWCTPRDAFYAVGKDRNLCFRNTHADCKALVRLGLAEKEKGRATEDSSNQLKRLGWRWTYKAVTS